MKNLMGINKKQKIIVLSILVLVFYAIGSPFNQEAFSINTASAENHDPAVELEEGVTEKEPKGLAGRIFNTILTGVDKFIAEILKVFGGIWLFLAGWFLGLTGIFLDLVMNFTVVDMSKNLKSIMGEDGGITVAWRTMRDLANIFFIFIILYIAIMTILRMDTATTKKLLVHVIIIALLINFSLFFTKVIIDTSNITATFFYEQIKDAGGNHGLSGAFMQPLGLTTFYDPTESYNLLNSVNSAQNVFLLGAGALMLFMITATVFIATAILLLIRFVVIIFLMVLSPLAFVAMALPKDNWSKKWWETLFSQSIFAPALFVFLWIALTIQKGFFEGNQQGSFAKLFSIKDKPFDMTASAGLLMNFVIIIGMLVFALVVAKLIGVQGGEKAVKWASNSTKRMMSAPPRQLLGRGAAMADKALGGTRFGQTAVGSMLRAPLTGLSKSKFGGKGPSGADFQKARDKRRDAFAKIEVEKAKKAGEKAEQEVVEQRSQRMATVEASPDKGKAGRIGRTYQAELDRIEQEKIDTVAVGARTQEEAEEEAGRQIMEARKKYLQEMKKLRERYKQRNTNAQIKGAQVKKAVMEQRAEELERPRGILRQTFSFSNKEQRIAAAKAIRTGKAPGQNIESVIRDILDEEKGGKDKGSDKDKK